VSAGCAGADPPTPAILDTGASPFELVGRLPTPPGSGRFTPTLLATDPRGRLLVADAARGTIFVYDGDESLGGWLADPTGGTGAGGARFQDLRALVATTGLSLYVLDAGPGLVHQYDLAHRPQGVALRLESTAVEARFGRVRAAALGIDRTGQPIVADREGDRLLVFDPHWSPRFEIGGPGSARGAFRDPAALAFGPDGRIYVADRGNGLVQVLDATGAFRTEHAFDKAPESLLVDGEGRLLVGDARGGVTRLEANGGRTRIAPGGDEGAAYLALSASGRRLYVSRPTAGRVDIYAVRADAESP
jgi:sugar lactone lactonase YvrE